MTQPDSSSMTWEIENFINSDSLRTSKRFKTKQTEFFLALFPKDNLSSVNNHVAIYLLRRDPLTIDLKVFWSISLINDKGEECYHKDIETNYSAQTSSKHYPIFGGLYHLDRDTILQSSSGLLSGGKLTVKCTVTILDDQNCANIAKLSAEDKTITLAQKKALRNYESHLEQSKLSDVVFVVGTKEFKLHKIILSSQSPVFAAMFDSDLDEAKQNRVVITDMDVEVFESMIRFIYTANVDSVQQYALELFVAADKYQLDSLKDICAQSLGSNLSIESVANILLVADMHSESELKSKCIEFINNKNTTKVFATDGWKQLKKSNHELVAELYDDLANKFENKFFFFTLVQIPIIKLFNTPFNCYCQFVCISSSSNRDKQGEIHAEMVYNFGD